MAHSKPHKDLSASILAGSEELFDFFCQPCSSEKHLEAVGYCQECCEYLCIACIRYHGKLAASKHHTVLDKSAMLKPKMPKKTQNTDVISEKCRKHPDKELEYFCKCHNQICCSVCVTLDHGSCSGKSYIPDISGGIASSKEYNKLIAEIGRLVGEITKRQKQIKDDGKNIGKYYDKALTDIRDFRKQINELLDQIEDDTKRKVTKFHQTNVGIIGTASEKCQSLLLEVNSMSANMDTSATAGKNNQLYVHVKLFFNRIAEVGRQLNENGKYRITPYAFEKDKKIEQIMSTLSAIWSLSVRQEGIHTKACYFRQVKVKADDDKNVCKISGVTALTNDRLVVADRSNKNVKLIDMKMNAVVSGIFMPSEPLDITGIHPNKVAVALGKEKKIGIITVANTLSLSQTIQTPDACIKGLCYDGSRFIAACGKSAFIKIIDMSGSTLNTINTGNNSEQLFFKPRHIALNRDRDVVYATDKKANTVVGMTLRGHVISVYKHDKLKRPMGVAVGKDGAVYVCSAENKTVHQLAPTLDFKQIILEHDKGLAGGPAALAYNEDVLYIGSHSSNPESKNYIRLFKLE